MASIHTAFNSEPRLVNERSFTVIGLATQTSNKDEMSGSGGRLGHLWHNFLSETDAQLPGNPDRSVIYCVYTDYEGDQNDGYRAVLGRSPTQGSVEVPNGLARVDIEGGEYLVFRALDRNPESIREAWSRIYDHFRQNTEHQRAFTADFDRYGPNGVEIYIALR